MAEANDDRRKGSSGRHGPVRTPKSSGTMKHMPATGVGSRRNELYMTLSPLRLLCCAVLVTTVTTAFDVIRFINDVGPEICPYTNFCHTNATKKIKNKKYMPCCIPCSCAEDCWETANCCPDAEVDNIQPPELNCKATMVKDKIRHANVRVYDGYLHGVESYRTVDFCPATEKNGSLKEHCEAKNKSKLVDYQWVSDKTGRIFQNMYCAVCHDVIDVVGWDIQTTCLGVLSTDKASLEKFLLSKDCDLKLNVPEKERSLTQKYRCFVPKVPSCVEEYNSSIQTACQTHEAPILYFHTRRFGRMKIYKNIYCLICHENTLEGIETRCKNILSIDRAPGTDSFHIVLDYRHTEIASKRPLNGDCKTDEIYDKYKRRCLRLLCPLGSAPYEGNCRTITMKTHNLKVKISYNLQALHTSKQILEFIGQNNSEIISNVVNERFLNLVRADGTNCPQCSFSLCKVEGSIKLSYTFYTTPECQLDKLVEQGTRVLGKRLKISFSDNSNFTFHIRLDRTDTEWPVTTRLVNSFQAGCRVQYSLKNYMICPTVRLNSSEMVGQFKSLLNMSMLKIVEDESATNSTWKYVCWSDYLDMYKSGTIILNTNYELQSSLVLALLCCHYLLGTAVQN